MWATGPPLPPHPRITNPRWVKIIGRVFSTKATDLKCFCPKAQEAAPQTGSWDMWPQIPCHLLLIPTETAFMSPVVKQLFLAKPSSPHPRL